MKNLDTYLRYAGLGCAAAAVVIALASMETQASATHRMNPESAIAVAFAGFVFLRASERSK
jgi:hypothetical protein